MFLKVIVQERKDKFTIYEENKMKINEIFSSIDGEGLRAGELATFIRVSGCNLRCNYCDTKYAWDENLAKEMSIKEILEEVNKYNVKNITITGGEPLIHKDIEVLINLLIKKGYKINIETNGSVDIEKYLNKCLITMDYKCESSLMEKTMLLKNIEKLTENDVLKFVIRESDFDNVEEVLQKYNIKSYIYISPVFNEVELPKIVEFMKKCNKKGINMSKARLQLQLHKIIWSPDTIGV